MVDLEYGHNSNTVSALVVELQPDECACARAAALATATGTVDSQLSHSECDTAAAGRPPQARLSILHSRYSFERARKTQGTMQMGHH